MTKNIIQIEEYNQAEILPSEFAIMVSKIYLENKSYGSRIANGQIFTSSRILDALLNHVRTHQKKNTVSLVDLGAGTGILAAAMSEELIKNNLTQKLYVDLVEIDADVIPYLRISMEYLKSWAHSHGCALSFNIVELNIIQDNPIDSIFHNLKSSSYDYVLSNPPYFKIKKGVKVSKYYEDIISGQANAYALFMYLGFHLVKPKGIVGFITPQSFFNGKSFTKLREFIFKTASLKGLTISDTNQTDFLDEKVKQRVSISCFIATNEILPISFSYLESFQSLIDLDPLDIIRDNVIYNPSKIEEFSLLKEVFQYSYKLKDFGLEVSTGHIVPHETPQYLSSSPTSIPLLWLKHIKDGFIEWPLKDFRRSEYLGNSSSSSKILKNGNYILLRRCAFSETKKHLYCAIFRGIEGYSHFSLENHVNFIYFKGNDLEPSDQKRLLDKVYNYLISRHASIYFASRCGSTQINADDIRSLPFPKLI